MITIFLAELLGWSEFNLFFIVFPSNKFTLRSVDSTVVFGVMNVTCFLSFFAWNELTFRSIDSKVVFYPVNHQTLYRENHRFKILA